MMNIMEPVITNKTLLDLSNQCPCITYTKNVENISTETHEYICECCRNCLWGKNPTMQDQACANHLQIARIPHELQDMIPVERRVISLHIPFLTMLIVRKYGSHYKVIAPCVNVPTTLDQVIEMLPHMSDQSQLHPLKIKKKT